MARVTLTQQNWSAGELSKKLAGRYDLGVYFNGAEWMQNFIATVQGMATFRSGSIFVWNTRDNQEAILVPFEYNTEQAYVLEFTNAKMRIIKDGGLVTETAQAITGITKANPAVVAYSGSDTFANGDRVVISGVVGMTQVNNREFTVANVNAGANTFELSGINSTAYGTYTSGGTVAEIVEVTTPYLEAELFDIDYAQTFDTMYMVHSTYEPRKITRSSHTAWTVATYSRTADPFGAGNYPSCVAFFEQRLIFAASDANPQRLWGSKGAAYDNFTTGTAADDAFVYNIASGIADRIRWMVATEDFLAIGTAGSEFKASGGGQDDAITPTNISIKPPSFYGSARVKPIRLDSHILYIQRDSMTTRSFEFDAIQDGYTSINRNITSDQITRGRYGKPNGLKQLAYQSGFPNITWGIKKDGLMTGLTFEPREQVNGWHKHVAGGRLTAGKNGKPEYGSVATIPQDENPDQVYMTVKRTVNGATVRYIEYFADQPNVPHPLDYYTGVEATDKEAYLQDMWEAQKRMVYLDSSVIYDGSEFATQALTFSAITVGTGRTITAGGAIFDTLGGAALVGKEIWGKAGGRAQITAYTDSTHVTVKITVAFPATTIAVSDWYLTASTFGGCEHLIGEDVTALADGGVVENLTVDENGKVDLESQRGYVIVGLSYLGIIKGMGIEGGGNNGPAQTKKKSMSQLGMKLMDTLGGLIGTNIYKLQRIKYRSMSDKMNRPPPLFTGVKVENIPDNWDEEKNLYFVQDKPQPANIQLFSPYMTTNDG
jgi:hypothetical protein